MATERNTIPVHKLKEHTDKGYHLKRFYPASFRERASIIGAHRDDHYIFLVQERGLSRGMVDFRSFSIEDNTIMIVLPGQVHSYEEAEEATTGWFLALDSGIIPEPCRAVLEDTLSSTDPYTVQAADITAMTQCLQMAHALDAQPASVYSRQAVLGLIVSFVAIATGLYDQRRNARVEKTSRPQVITREFRQMLTREYKQWKSPGEYADALHLSAPYLNEAVKETTGFTVSHWIQQEVMLEAKRLLFHSLCSVKEIAYELGYDDPTYFSRLFKKSVGRTPGEFRDQYRK